MLILYLLADFFAGAFLCNCIPHLAAGLRGELFPTPFAKPPGKGFSSALVNFCWGTFNLVVGLILLVRDQFTFDFNLATITFYSGFILAGVLLSKHFQTVQSRR